MTHRSSTAPVSIKPCCFAARCRGDRPEKEHISMHRLMKKTAAALLPLLVILTLGLAACGPASDGSTPDTQRGTSANEVAMGATTFAQTSVTIAKGQSVHFVDQQSGTMHILCIGQDGNCDPNAKGPPALTGQGFTIQPGQSQDVPFDTAGTFPVTCTIHPNMNVLVTVR
jgi:plastocyanin